MSAQSQELCPEAAFRAGLSDEAFWDYVLLGVFPGLERFDDGPWDDGPDDAEVITGSPCPLCGAAGACGYDDEGRALIHAVGVQP